MTDAKRKPYKKRIIDVNGDNSSISEIGKSQPQAVELEEVVLGALLLESSISDLVMAEISPNIFYKEQNQLIAEVIIELYKQSKVIDILTVIQKLKENGKLELVGGAYYVSSLTNRIASSANIEFHIKILQQESLKRTMILISTQAIRKSYGESVDVFDLYSETQTAIDDALKDVLHYEVEKIGSIHERNILENLEILKAGGVAGIRSGLKEVDTLTNGWQRSDLIILAGRPSMGKTACAVSMAIFPALSEDIPVAIFSLEMSKTQIVGRIQSSLSGINVSRIIKKQLTMEEIKEIDNKCVDLYKAKIFIDDTPNISLIELKSKCRRLVREKDVKLIVIDYLQLMRSGTYIGNREQEVAEISRGLKALSKELDIPIIALSQLSRGVDSRPDKKPGLADLRESGQIEQDADMVIFCYRPEYYGIEQYELAGETFSDTRGLFLLIIAKHRNGEIGEIPLRFIGEQTKLVNYQSLSEMMYDSERDKPKQVMQNNTEFLNKPVEEMTDKDIPF